MKKSEIILYKFIIVMVICIYHSSCGDKQAPPFNQEERARLDSMIHSVSDIESHEKMMQQFEQTNNGTGIMLLSNVLGKEYRNKSRFSDAIVIYRKGLLHATNIRDTLTMVDLHNNLGTCFRRIAVLDKASSHHYKALMLCESYSDTSNVEIKKYRVISLNGIGNVHLTLGELEIADSLFRLSLEGEKSFDSHLGLAINYANIGAIFEQKNQIDSARHYYNKSLACNKSANSIMGIALCHIHFGNLYEKENRLELAFAECEKAYHLLENDPDRWHWLSACEAMAKICIKLGHMTEAQHYISEALQTAKTINSFEKLKEAHKLYSDYYKALDNYKNAMHHFILSDNYEDSISNSKIIDQLQNQRVRYEQENRHREMRVMNQIIKSERKHKTIFGITTLVIFMLTCILFFIFRYTQHVHKRNHKMVLKLEETRTTFFRNITHEFRTPLTVILGFGKQLMENKVEDPIKLRKIGETIYRQGSGIIELVNQLLEITRLRTTTITPEYKTGDIVAHIRMLVEIHHELAATKNIELTYTPSETQLNMDFVPDYIVKIIRNLIGNSIKYTPPYGKIYVTTNRENSYLILNVADTGQGISETDQEHIFDLFYQVQTSEREIGSGIGLSLVKQLVETMKGYILLESAEGAGTVFTIKLPLKQGNKKWKPFQYEKIEHIKPLPEDTVEDMESEEINEIKPTILIVEDNMDISRYIGSLVNEQYNCFYARNGKDGFNKAADLMPDIILTDLMMPEMDGLALCREIRKSEILSHIPIIIITARTSHQDKIKGIEAGADAYLYKPFDSEELYIRINNLLSLRRVMKSKISAAMRYGTEAPVNYTRADQEFVNKFVDTVYAHMNSCTAEVDSVASTLCMTPKQLRHKLYAITGEYPLAYIQRIRMTHAKRLLDSHDELPIADVALKCGFNDISYFSRIFRKTFGMTPTQYRRMPADT